VSSSTSFGGLPTVMDYVLNAKDEDVVDSNFMHDRWGRQQQQHSEEGGMMGLSVPRRSTCSSSSSSQSWQDGGAAHDWDDHMRG
jgi:hypothetical protein